MNKRFNKLLQYCKHDKSYQCRTSIFLCMQNSTSIISIILDSTCGLHIIVYRDEDFSNSTSASNKQVIYRRYLKRMCNDLKKNVHIFLKIYFFFFLRMYIFFLRMYVGLENWGNVLNPFQRFIRPSGVPIDLKKYLFFLRMHVALEINHGGGGRLETFSRFNK